VVFNDALATQEAAFLAGATTLPGASSFGFWKKRRFVTAVPSVGSTDGSRPLDCARPVDWWRGRQHFRSGSGPASAAPSM